MKLRREASVGLGALVSIVLLMAMLSIALLSRMGPAIERILQENVYSEAAVEEMLALLATRPPGDVPDGFEEALKRAEENVTEDAERPLLRTIAEGCVAAFEGGAAERADVVDALQALGRVNRESMARADQTAKRLGQAGAWAAAVLGALSLALSIGVYRRLRLRIELPIEALRRTTQRYRGGNRQARCPPSDGPHEVRQLAENINWLLDRSAPEPVAASTRDDIRRALIVTLDALDAPAAIWDQDGSVVATSKSAMDAPTDDPSAWTVEPIAGSTLRLARWNPPSEDG